MKHSLPSQIPADIDSLKKIGLRSWLESCYWPVSDEQFFGMLDVLWKVYDHLYERLDEKGRDLVLADTDFIGYLAQRLHAVAVRQECTKRGIKVLVDAKAKEFYETVNPSFGQRYRLLLKQMQNPWLFRLRSVAKEVRFNDHLPVAKRVFGFLSDRDHWSLGSYSGLKSDYMEKYPIYLAHPYWQSLVSGMSWKQGDALPEDMRESIERFFKELSNALMEFLGVRPDLSDFFPVWMQRLRDLEAIYQHIRRIRRPPKTVLLAEVVHPMHKVICLALKKEGTEIIGFHHGNDMGNVNSKLFGYVQACHLNLYACPTRESADLHARKYRLCGIHPMNAVEFISVDTLRYKSLLDTFSSKSPPPRIDTVMVMGFPMNAIRYPYSSGDFFLLQLDLELRILRVLKEHVYRFLYKLHP